MGRHWPACSVAIHCSIPTQRRYGATFGGPIARDRTFFLLNYEGSSQAQVGGGTTITVPTDAMRNGDFSATTLTIVDPQTGLPFPGNRIPADRLDRAAQNILNFYYPHANLPPLASGLGRAQYFDNLETNRAIAGTRASTMSSRRPTRCSCASATSVAIRARRSSSPGFPTSASRIVVSARRRSPAAGTRFSAAPCSTSCAPATTGIAAIARASTTPRPWRRSWACRCRIRRPDCAGSRRSRSRGRTRSGRSPIRRRTRIVTPGRSRRRSAIR